MHKTRFGMFLIMMGVCVTLHARCPHSALEQMPFLVEYAVWRGWHQALIYTIDSKPSCRWAIKCLVKSLNGNGIAVAVDVCKSCTAQSRLGVVIFSPPLRRNYTNRLSNTVNEIIKLGLNTASYDWLLMARSEYDIKLMNNMLNDTAVRFDQNIIAVYPSSIEKSRSEFLLLSDRNIYQLQSKYKTINPINIRMDSLNNGHQNNLNYDFLTNEFIRNHCYNADRYKNTYNNYKISKISKTDHLLNLGITYMNNSRQFQMLNATALSLKKQFGIWSRSRDLNVSHHRGEMHIVQYFKVRANSTLYATYLGAWLPERSLLLVQVPYSVEERNFLGEELIIGRSNSTGNSIMGMDDERLDSPALLDDLLDFISVRLNITSVSRYYSQLGFRTYEGVWTGLLGALMDSSVDIALEPVTALTSRYQDMDFVFPIAETMCNIYIRHKETSAVRDIFLAPFSNRLVACVAAVAVVAAITVGLISRLAPCIEIGTETRTMSCTESLLWSIGILCQQGGQWTPPIPAASITLIACLLFAVVMYNSYAAFITSVLSVRVPSVASVSDVLQSSNFKIGYIRNGADQMYLMSTKDVQLNAFYIRGYSEAENLVTSVEEGLARAARQDYAFFTGQLAARSTLSKLSQARGRCALRELPVPSTRAQLAFPLPRRSPYARPVLISLLQLRSSGALARLEAALVPPLPQCAPPSGFASARAADVKSALLLLLLGLLASLVIGRARATFLIAHTRSVTDAIATEKASKQHYGVLLEKPYAAPTMLVPLL